MKLDRAPEQSASQTDDYVSADPFPTVLLYTILTIFVKLFNKLFSLYRAGRSLAFIERRHSITVSKIVLQFEGLTPAKVCFLLLQ